MAVFYFCVASFSLFFRCDGQFIKRCNLVGRFKGETGSVLCRSALWDCFGDARLFFHWLLRGCAGNWVRIPTPTHRAIRHDTDSVQNGEWSFELQKNPGNSNSNNSNFSFPLDFTPLFSIFYSVKSNSANSYSPLTRTKFPFPCSKLHWNLPW